MAPESAVPKWRFLTFQRPETLVVRSFDRSSIEEVAIFSLGWVRPMVRMSSWEVRMLMTMMFSFVFPPGTLRLDLE